MDERILSLHAGYDHKQRPVDAYLARPAVSEVRPAVVLVSGMHGLNWFQRQITRRFAQAGFVTLSPDILEGSLPEDRASALLVKNSLDVDLTVDIIAAGAYFLRSLPWVEPDGRVGLVGFCLGGGLALLTLARTDQFQSGVIYYHSLFPDPQELEHIDCELLCHYGTEDKTTPKEEVEAFRSVLEGYDKQYEIAFYEGVGHAFVNPGASPSAQHQKAITESLEKTFEFLRRLLTR